MKSENRWPKGGKIAVLISVILESWSEGKAPPYSPMTLPLREGGVPIGNLVCAARRRCEMSLGNARVKILAQDQI